MKKIFFIFLTTLVSTTFAASSDWNDSANFIASKWLISDHSNAPEEYRLKDSITRRESIKIIVKLAGWEPSNTCDGKFSDVSADDWSCKYVEWALDNWLIASAWKFRPGDNITRAETLKLIFKAKGIAKMYTTDNWQSDYYKTALSLGLVDSSEDDGSYSANALRGWIFYSVAKTYGDYSKKIISNEAL